MKITRSKTGRSKPGAPARVRDDMVAELGKHLKAIREQRGLTTRGLADLASVPQSTVLRYEYGEREPRIFNLVKIARALGCVDQIGEFLKNSAGRLDKP